MTTYGQSPQDVVTDSRGNVLRGVALKIYTTQAAASAGGTPLATVTTDVRGRWSYSSDEPNLWARLPDGTTWQVANDPAGLVTAAEAAAASAAASADAAITAGSAAAASYGFRTVISDTTPGYTELDGYPVVWLHPTGTLADVPAEPVAPAWDIVNRTVLAPDLVGVEYLLDGSPLTPGVATPISGVGTVTVTVDAVALPGYSLLATYSWDKQFVDFADSTLWLTDGFSGTTGPMAGRTLDMYAGGSSPSTPTWGTGYYGSGNLFRVDGSGHAAWSRDTAIAAGANDGGRFDVGHVDFYVDLDFTQFPKQHNEYHLPQAELVLRDGRPLRRLPLLRRRHRVEPQRRRHRLQPRHASGTATANPFIGTWRISSFGQVLTAEAPDASTFSSDRSADSPAGFGTYFLLDTYSGTSDGTPVLIDNLQVGVWGV